MTIELSKGELKTLEFAMCEVLREDIKTYWNWMKSNSPDKQKFIKAIKEGQANDAALLKKISYHIMQ